MPVSWTISHPARLVIALAKNDLKVEDIEQYFAGVTAEGAMSYRKIFEIAATPVAINNETLKTLGQRVILYAQHGQIGPVAIVAGSDESYAKAQAFASAANGGRPLQIFREMHAARGWLDQQATRAD